MGYIVRSLGCLNRMIVDSYHHDRTHSGMRIKRPFAIISARWPSSQTGSLYHRATGWRLGCGWLRSEVNCNFRSTVWHAAKLTSLPPTTVGNLGRRTGVGEGREGREHGGGMGSVGLWRRRETNGYKDCRSSFSRSVRLRHQQNNWTPVRDLVTISTSFSGRWMTAGLALCTVSTSLFPRIKTFPS